MKRIEDKPNGVLGNKHSSTVHVFSIFMATIKPMGLFASGLYLFGFGCSV